jgi:hypothetical protein
MKKLGFGVSIFLFVAAAFSSSVFAADSITESPDVKIVIEGKMGAYTDVPIITNGRTMLPLREVLTNLGVQNDDQHIIWDGTKKSVTVKKDDSVIYLEVGKTNGNVNGNEVEIDVAPIIYNKNNRVYIPARFVAESLGKEVVWDAATRSVLIADKITFNQVKDIITKSNEAMKDVKKYKIDMGMKTKMSQNAYSMDYEITMKVDVDEPNKAMHSISTMDMFGAKIDSEMYLKDGCSYTKDSATGKWEKEVLTESEFEDLFSSNAELNSFTDEDINKLSAGMVVSESKNPDEIVLKGNVLASFVINNGLSGWGTEQNPTDDLGMNQFYLELTYDKNTYLMKSFIFNLSGDVKDETGAGQFDIQVDLNVSDYNGNFEIELPKEAIADNG